jgi:hypothetical protein
VYFDFTIHSLIFRVLLGKSLSDYSPSRSSCSSFLILSFQRFHQTPKLYLKVKAVLSFTETPLGILTSGSTYERTLSSHSSWLASRNTASLPVTSLKAVDNFRVSGNPGTLAKPSSPNFLRDVPEHTSFLFHSP